MEQPILNSKIIGDGQKHLFVFHGLFGQIDNWNTHGRQFGEFFTTHLIDLRNHGRSFHAEDSSIEAMADDITNYMNFHGINKAHLLGHSLGGRVVMDFAVKFTEKVDHLIVADMAPKAYPPHHNSIFKALLNVDFNIVQSRKDVEQILSQHIPEAGVKQFLLKNVYHAENGQYAFRFYLKALHLYYEAMVGKDVGVGIFEGPTLFLKGENSDYILPEDDFVIKNRFPNSEVKTIKNAGHWVHAENPIDFIKEILDFLNN